MPVATSHRPRVYALYQLSPPTLALAKEKFDLVSPSDPGFENWREDAEGLMVRSTDITDADVARFKRVRFIAKHGVGVDRLRMKALKSRGVVTMNTAGANATAVAELSLGLMFSLARNIPYIDRTIRSGAVLPNTTAGAPGFQLTGKTLGIIGGGNIGYALGKMFAAAFGSAIVVYDPFLGQEKLDQWARVPNYSRSDSLDGLLERADIVSVHVPLEDQTRDMIGRAELRTMKKTAILINAARGGVVNEDDLADALEAGDISGAAIDAWSVEPPELGMFSRLISHPRVITTPHIGAASPDVVEATAVSVINHLAEALSGQPPRDVV